MADNLDSLTYEMKDGILTIWRGKVVHHRVEVGGDAQAVLDGYEKHGLTITKKG